MLPPQKGKGDAGSHDGRYTETLWPVEGPCGFRTVALRHGPKRDAPGHQVRCEALQVARGCPKGLHSTRLSVGDTEEP